MEILQLLPVQFVIPNVLCVQDRLRIVKLAFLGQLISMVNLASPLVQMDIMQTLLQALALFVIPNVLFALALQRIVKLVFMGQLIFMAQRV